MKITMLAVLLLASLPYQGTTWANDQDVARAARERGVAAPFEQILAAARAAVPARTKLLDATLLPRAGRQLVEVFLRETIGGRIVSVVVDGRAAEVVSVSGGGRKNKLRTSEQTSSSAGGGDKFPGPDSRGRSGGRGGRGGGRGGARP